MIYARNAWDHDPHLATKYKEKNGLHFMTLAPTEAWVIHLQVEYTVHLCIVNTSKWITGVCFIFKFNILEERPN